VLKLCVSGALRRLVPRTPGLLFSFAVGCSGSDDGSGRSSRDHGLSLEEACAASCQAQAATNCPGVFAPGQCTGFCVEYPEFVPECTDAWVDINACMSTAPLSCDRVNGGASVSSQHCGPEIEAMTSCSD